MSSAQQMQELRRSLLAEKDSTYLGEKDPAIASKFSWVRVGSGDVLTRTEDAKTYFDAREAHFNDPDHVPRPEAPNAALFSAVTKISRNAFYMQSCGIWTPDLSKKRHSQQTQSTRASQEEITRDFQKLRLTALGKAAEHLVFRPDWASVVSNLEAIRKTKRNEGFETQGPFVDGEFDGRCVKFRHVLFEVMLYV